MQKANFGGGKRWFATGFAINGKGYIGTGANDTTTCPDFWEYNVLTDTWTGKANFPKYRFGCVGFSIGNEGYIGTGVYCGVAYPELYQYSPTSDIWVQKSSLQGTGRWRACSFVIGNKATVGTGRDIYSNLLQDIYEYNSTTDTWMQKADYGGGIREGASGFSLLGKGYISAGYGHSFNYKNDLWQYIPDTSDVLTSMKFYEKVNNVKIYPNPNDGQFIISNDEDKNMDITITDMSGNIIYERANSKFKIAIDISDQPKGVYLIKLLRGNLSSTERIMIE